MKSIFLILAILLCLPNAFANEMGFCLESLSRLIQSGKYDQYVEVNSIHQRWSGPHLRIRVAMEQAQKITPQSRTWHITKVRPYFNKGRILTAYKSNIDHDYNEVGMIIEFIKQFPAIAKRFHLSVYQNEIETFLTYPDPMALEAIIDQLYKVYDPWRPHLRFRSFNGKEASAERFVRNWINGRIIISNDGYHHFHDVMVHMIGYLILPRNVMMGSRLKFQTITEIINHPFVSGNKEYAQSARKWLVKHVGNLDGSTHFYLRHIFDSSASGLAIFFYNLTNLPDRPKFMEQIPLDHDFVKFFETKLNSYHNSLDAMSFDVAEEALNLIKKFENEI